MPLSRHPHGVGIARMNQHPADVMRLFEPAMLPGRAAVERTVDAIAVVGAVAQIGLAGADPDHVRPAGSDRHVADGGHGFVVEDGLERHSVVDRLPEPAGTRGDVEEVGLRLRGGERHDPAARLGRSDPTELEMLDELLDLRLGRDRGRQHAERGDQRQRHTSR